MKAYEITFSPTGGTKKVTNLILSEFNCDKEEISLLPKETNYGNLEFTGEDVCVIGVPSFGGRVPETAVNRVLDMKGNGARAVLVCVYGNRAYEDTLLELKNTALKAGFQPIAAVAAVAEHSIMRQYAQGRPDEKDQTEIIYFAKKIWSKISSDVHMEEVSVPGNEEYRKYGGVPFKPSAGKQCNECGICAKECPTGAIDVAHPKETDNDKCISCMRCIAVCPNKARSLNKLVLAAAAKKMAKVFKERKKNEIFLG